MKLNINPPSGKPFDFNNAELKPDITVKKLIDLLVREAKDKIPAKPTVKFEGNIIGDETKTLAALKIVDGAKIDLVDSGAPVAPVEKIGETKANEVAEAARVLVSPREGDQKNVELAKYYTFNETGNIMMATTVSQQGEIQDSVRGVFAEVTVFFAAMTKALSQTNRSLYDYDALEKIIDGSACFIHVTELDVTHQHTGVAADFSKELIQALLGLPAGAGALGFANAMISSVGKEAVRMQFERNSSTSKVGNIVFVCEYLMGMPSISAIVVYIESKTASELFQAGPCVKVTHEHQEIKMHKDTYMFVTPKFIREYAGDLDSVFTDAAYGKLVVDMKNLLK